ncbi:MAG TPA: bifunctional (p)ppGpp synthetase/guanosine-3',5'-bis(diphosphate) 3'-pyrophosphohydrolase [Burkholderiales bacterium]|nr:bifunctional (p)ppGpp synthetase/guanosine-3',5'-bis(diphosphate) 3'-pyrophosphohydrolase [Burkholderiales bacterium]
MDPGSPVISRISPDAESWMEHFAARLEPAEAALVRRALDFALPLYEGKSLATGEPVAENALGTAGVLAQLRLDPDSLAAAILHAAPEYLADWAEKLRTNFGGGVLALVEGVARMGQIRLLAAPQQAGGDAAAQAEGLRKMLLAMVQDIRVVIIKLAERTQALRYAVGRDAPGRQEIAREARDIFAPLANRLGVWNAKWELEDLSFRVLHPDVYKHTARLLDERRVDRERYIAEVIATLRAELDRAGIAAEVRGRPKHIYSIYKKMQRKQVDFGEIYDARAVRILVNDVKDCYAALGIVHNLWTPIPKEFDDYIAKPKGNDYRSLHTAVVGPEGKALEVQIRTHEMHQQAELGFAAHWRYKEGARHDPRYDEKIAWLRQILDWKEDVVDAEELAEQFKTALFEDAVYVFTPQGKVIDLPRGSTPIDFAYHVHTDLGHRCRGAKVDGAIVPLNYQLKNAQRVEIIATKQGGPSRDWVNPAHGFLKSPRARTKVRQWFKSQEHDAALAQGRAMLEQEIRRQGLGALNFEKAAERFRYPKLEEFLLALARGDIKAPQLASGLREGSPPPAEETPAVARRRSAPDAGGGILVLGVDKLLTSLAKCCRPVPPDPIIGFVSRGRGVTIHRQGCPSVARLSAEGQERLIAAEWGRGEGAVYLVSVQVDAHDRQGLLRDVSEVFSRERINVIATNTLTRSERARMQFTVEITGGAQLGRVLAQLKEVPSVIAARRA